MFFTATITHILSLLKYLPRLKSAKTAVHSTGETVKNGIDAEKTIFINYFSVNAKKEFFSYSSIYAEG